MMRKIASIILSMAAALPLCGQVANMEALDRGLVVAKGNADGTYFASWRLLASDAPGTTFTILRDGKPYKKGLSGATSAVVKGTPDSRWQVVAETKGKEMGISRQVTAWSRPYLRYHLQKPAGGNGYDYTVNDLLGGRCRRRRTVRADRQMGTYKRQGQFLQRNDGSRGHRLL